MSLTKRIAQHTIIQFVGKIIGTVFGLVTIGLITRYLGTTSYGYYTTIFGFIHFFGILVDFGLTITTAQMLGTGRWQQDELFGNILSLRVVSSFLVLALGSLIALVFPYPGFVKAGIALMAVSFFFIGLVQIFLGYYQKHLQMQYVSAAEVGGRLFLLLAVFFAIFFDLGLFGILIAITLSNLFQLLMLSIPAKKFGRIYFSWNTNILRDIWDKTWPIALTIAFNLLYLRTDIILLSLFRSPEEVGIYGASYKVVDVLSTIPFMISGLLLPLLAEFWKKQDPQKFKELIQHGFDALSLIALPLVVGTYFVAHDVMALVAGESFRVSGDILRLLIVAIAFIFLNSIFAHAIVALNKQKASIPAYGITALLGILGYIIFIPLYGGIGAAVVTIVTEGIIALLIYLLYKKHSGLSLSFKKWISFVPSSAGMGLVLWLTASSHVILQVIFAVIAYFILLLVTKGISRSFIQDTLSLRSFRR